VGVASTSAHTFSKGDRDPHLAAFLVGSYYTFYDLIIDENI
jgi:hypothetical protein